MDTIFLLGDGERSNFLQHMIKFFGCTYICLWQYLPKPSDCLLFFDGVGLANDQLSSSSQPGGSRTQRLFDQYRLAAFNIIDNNGVPGLAFKNQTPFIELKLVDIERLASIAVQLQFYREAGVKRIVFMGCNNGEIELGFNNDTQVDLEMKLKKWFPEDFSRVVVGGLPREVVISTDQNFPSSSSSSMLSLSADSSELFSPHLFNIQPSTSNNLSTPIIQPSATASAQTLQDLSRIRNVQLPNIESEDAALTQAMIAVMTSPSSSSSSFQSNRNMLTSYQVQVQPNQATAFRMYNTRSSSLLPTNSRTQKSNMFKRAITFYRGLALIQSHELQRAGPRSTLHMISERKRREKLNESFQVLRTLLPPGTKRDKASVLASTTQYLSALKSQVEELGQRTQILEAQLLLPQEKGREQEGGNSTVPLSSSSERVVVNIVKVDESTSEEGRVVDLQVADLRGQSFSILDLAICVLEYLKSVNYLNVISMEANTRPLPNQSNSFNHISVRFRIQGDEWDESAFEEAIRRVVADLAQ